MSKKLITEADIENAHKAADDCLLLTYSLRSAMCGRPPVVTDWWQEGVRALELCLEANRAHSTGGMAEFAGSSYLVYHFKAAKLLNEVQQLIARTVNPLKKQGKLNPERIADAVWEAARDARVLPLPRKRVNRLRRAIADERLKLLGVVKESAMTAPDDSPPQATLLSAGDLEKILTARLGRECGGVDSFLARHRKVAMDCFEFIEGQRKTEPRILYRTKDVWPILWRKYSAKK
jgi:hypothetical protein